MGQGSLIWLNQKLPCGFAAVDFQPVVIMDWDGACAGEGLSPEDTPYLFRQLIHDSFFFRILYYARMMITIVLGEKCHTNLVEKS